MPEVIHPHTQSSATRWKRHMASPDAERRNHTAVEWIDPSVAASMLERNISNRRLSKSTINSYAALMKHGRWILLQDAIAFDVNGNLINGQHRLHAVIKSGTTQPFVLIDNLSLEAFQYIDGGKPRTLSDHLDRLGVKNYNLTAVIAIRLAFYAKAGRLVSSIARSGPNGNPGSPLWADMEDRVHLAMEYGPLERSVEFASAWGRRTPIMKGSVVGFVHALYYPWLPEIESFLERAVTGLELTRGDPAHALRQKLEANAAQPKHKQWSGDTTIGYAIIAANAFAKGRRARVLKWADDTYPQPLKQVAPDICEALEWQPPANSE